MGFHRNTNFILLNSALSPLLLAFLRRQAH
jgi:hypothetical protein